MRSRLAEAIGLILALSAGEGCVLVWSYGSFHDQPDSGAQGTGGDKTCELQTEIGSFCCAGSCGTCKTCDADASTCEAVPKGMPGPGCSGSKLCDGLGHCAAVPNGGACPVDGGACLSGICVGSICCAAACATCTTCATDGAMCVALPVGTADPACPAGTTCDGSGNCVM